MQPNSNTVRTLDAECRMHNIVIKNLDCMEFKVDLFLEMQIQFYNVT